MIIKNKGRLRTTIFESAETVHLILLCYFGAAVRWAVSAEKKMVAHNRPLILHILIIHRRRKFPNIDGIYRSRQYNESKVFYNTEETRL